MKKTIVSIALLSLTTTFYSCKKERADEKTPDVRAMNGTTVLNPFAQTYFEGIDQSNIRYMPSTEDEVIRAVMIAQITDVFKELYKNDDFVKLVNCAIKSGLYTDETILLKELISAKELPNNAEFLKLSTGLGTDLSKFSQAFWTAVATKKDPNLDKFLATVVSETGSLNSQISVYFPYSEDYNVSNADVSLVAGIADCDAILGFQRTGKIGSISYDSRVEINDTYAATIKPTHIVGVNGTTLRRNTVVPLADFEPGGDIPTPGLPRAVKQVYTGDVKCKKQYDALVSLTGNGGGSEIRFVKGDGYLKTNGGQVDASTPEQPNDISRKNIRKENWINWTREFHSDWREDNHQIFIAIYEEDNRNTTETSATLSTTVKDTSNPNLNLTGTVGVKVTYKSDDGIIFQDNLHRDVFFVLNRSSNLSTCGMHAGWPVRNCNSDVEFTLADRTLTP